MTTGDSRIDASPDDIRINAAQWRDIAAAMSEAARCVARLSLGAKEFSFIADMLGMVDLYRETQDHLLALLGEAERTHEWLALALDTAADNYYVIDVAAARKLGQIQ